MASIYEDEILGAQQQRDLARKLRDTEVPSTGHMIGDWYVAPTVAQQLSAVLKQGIGAYKENQAEDEINAAKRNRNVGNIQTLNEMGIAANPAMLAKAGTPAESASPWDRLKAFVTPGASQPQGIPAQPYKQTVAQNPTVEAKRNAMIQYQLNNGGDLKDLSKLLAVQHNLRPEFTIGPKGEKFVTTMDNPTVAHQVMLSSDIKTPLTSTLYSPSGIAERTQAKQRYTPIRVPTKQGVTIMSGVEALGGDTSLPPTDENGGVLHYDPENDSSAYIYPDGSYREVQ
jgi:hypothetical protein